MKYTVYIIVISVCALLTGCVGAVVYNPSYLNVDLQSKLSSTNCKAFIYTTESDDKFVYKGHPSSATGAAHEIEMPLGVFTKEIAKHVFNQACLGGAQISRDLKAGDARDLIIYPKITRFDYRYNDTKNLGLAVTTQVRVMLDIAILDMSGNACYTGNYDSGYVDGNTAIIQLSPLENVNKTTHKVILELMTRAASDIIHQKNIDGVDGNNSANKI